MACISVAALRWGSMLFIESAATRLRDPWSLVGRQRRSLRRHEWRVTTLPPSGRRHPGHSLLAISARMEIDPQRNAELDERAPGNAVTPSIT